LKSDFVLQIPEADDIRIDLSTALDEVALQNEEWARGVASESQGLTLVADAKTEAAETSEFVSDETIISDDSTLLTEDYADLSDEAPSDVAGASISDELDALMITVSRLQDSIDSLEAQLAERDAELDSLRSALAEQQAATLVPVVVGTPTAPTTQPARVLQAMPLWPFLAGLATLLVGAGLLIWRRLRRNAASAPLDHADLKDALPAEAIDEASDPSRLSDPQIMASKAVEEAQTYIAYGRTDQAVEVLNDALAEGLTSVALIMCLLECYIELEQFAEADALLERLEQGDNPGLLERARQMLLDAGMALTPLDDDADAAEAPAADNVDMDESIYGAETNPVDSKLDLARAYLDMGDEDGARPVLLEVIKEGDLAQRAEARELFLRLEAP
jgi:pilus assembly protein FimV